MRTGAESAALSGITEEQREGFVLTKPVSVQEMHGVIKDILTSDPAAFMAGIPE